MIQALYEIAHRYILLVAKTNSGSIQRLDFFFKGTRTHTVHVVTPVVARVHPLVPQDGIKSGPKLAIILDDMGYDRAAADAAFALQFPITLSFRICRIRRKWPRRHTAAATKYCCIFRWKPRPARQRLSQSNFESA